MSQNNDRTLINSTYLYFINPRRDQEQLCRMEMKSIFGVDITTKLYFSDTYINPKRSVYIKGYIDILYQFKDIEKMKQKAIDDNLSFEKYKIRYHKSSDHVKYDTWIHALKVIGSNIIGEFAIQDPLIDLVMTRINGVWIFGKFTKGNEEWMERISKPINYSHALEVKLAKSIMNIAINNDFNLTVIDPCCGIGTVVIEGLEMGVNIEGYDFNRNVVKHANQNLQHFGFKPIIKHKDIHHINKQYDVAILDIPYGQFSFISLDDQISLIKETRRIADKAIIVTMEDMSDLIIKCGFRIEEKCELAKSNAFSRFIFVCR